MSFVNMLQLCAGEDDIRTIMEILLQNLNEGATLSETGKLLQVLAYFQLHFETQSA